MKTVEIVNNRLSSLLLIHEQSIPITWNARGNRKRFELSEVRVIKGKII